MMSEDINRIVGDLLSRVEAAERTIAQQSLLITEQHTRIMMMESETILYDEIIKLAKNVDDAFGEVARNLEKSQGEIYDSIWRRKNVN
jgi:hypothetical protein